MTSWPTGSSPPRGWCNVQFQSLRCTIVSRAILRLSHLTMRGRGIWGQFLPEVPSQTAVESSKGCSNKNIVDELRSFIPINTVFNLVQACCECGTSSDTPICFLFRAIKQLPSSDDGSPALKGYIHRRCKVARRWSRCHMFEADRAASREGDRPSKGYHSVRKVYHWLKR